MKLLLFSDNHWSQYSSIVRGMGNKYSKRLENQIDTLNWVEILAEKEKVDCVVCLGDFFDSSMLNSMEITALKEIKWANIPHKFIVGNHEMGRNDLALSSSHLFDLLPNSTVIEKPTIEDNILYLPYILENDRKPLKDYLNEDVKFILSHNDIAGVQMGKFVSTVGFSIDELEKSNCIFINGHLHNGGKVGKTNKVWNIGNITGQNFSEDNLKVHEAILLDTEDTINPIREYINPYAFYFCKLDLTNKSFKQLDSLFPNSVVTVKCKYEDVEKVKEILVTKDIVENRILIEQNKTASDIASEKFVEKINHRKKFAEYVLSHIGDTDPIKEELSEVIK